MERTVYLVRTGKNGFLSTRRFNHREGSHAVAGAPFNTTRLFARKLDALAACQMRSDEVVEATVTLKVS